MWLCKRFLSKFSVLLSKTLDNLSGSLHCQSVNYESLFRLAVFTVLICYNPNFEFHSPGIRLLQARHI